MLKKFLLSLFILMMVLAGFYIFQPMKTGQGLDRITRYSLDSDWPDLPAELTMGEPTGIGIDSQQNIFVFHRAGREWPLLGSMPSSPIYHKTILLLDHQTGKVLASWGDSLFIMPHGLTVDHENNVWVTDVGLHQVFKFNHEGKLLLKLGESGVAGSDNSHFNSPTDVAIRPGGSIYVSDGYGNSRIMKFSPEGRFLLQWGKKGKGEGEFSIPHGITLDEKENVYVADRENSRVQVFDSSGKFLYQWKENSFGALCSIAHDPIRKQWVATDDLRFLKIKHRGSDILVFDTKGKVQSRVGRSGSYEGEACWYHDVAVDKEGMIYTADLLGKRVQRFKKHSLKIMNP